MEEKPKNLPIWMVRGLTDTQHRLIWWIVDAGGFKRILKHGWQQNASACGVANIATIARAVRVLVEHGILIKHAKGCVQLNARSFKTGLAKDEVKTMSWGGLKQYKERVAKYQERVNFYQKNPDLRRMNREAYFRRQQHLKGLENGDKTDLLGTDG